MSEQQTFMSMVSTAWRTVSPSGTSARKRGSVGGGPSPGR